jgi:hypothetical protein
MGRSRALVGEFFSDDVASSFAEALDSVHLEYSNSDTGGPTSVGCLSIPEIEKLIQDLAKELKMSSILRHWLLWMRRALCLMK